MLTSLRIENFAIVKELELDFSPGMTAFTGETGAGKSIMIDALMLALGGRGDATVVRQGEEKCDITAIFSLAADEAPKEWLTAHDVTADDEVVLRRIIYAEGRSKSSINGQPFPLQKVKELSEMLVHIHGQHQHQTLLQHPTHRQQLDQYAQHPQLLARVSQLYKQCQQVQAEIERLQSQDRAKDRLDLLAFQIQELTGLQLQAGEWESLHQEHQCLHHAHDYLSAIQEINGLLQGEDQFGINPALHQILQRLQSLPKDNKAVANCLELINSALIQCEEAADEMGRFADQVQLDPARLHEVEQRMSQLHQAARKYHVEVQQLPERAEELNRELTALQAGETRLLELQNQYQTHLQSYQAAARELTASRQHQAQGLAQEITAIIQQLGMPKGRVEIEISPLEKMQAHGQDRVEYKVCTNPGTLPDALSKIASGGELSRISLAIQMITAQQGATPTLLFDEVDVGIGGATAALVGRLLRQLGQRLQIFCVTHQPQVASCAHHHYRVEKQSDGEQTYSQIIPLPSASRIEEIARMLGGLTINDQTRRHAQSMLEEMA